MKLLYCHLCGDVFQLRRKVKTCECGQVKGLYVDSRLAKISKNAISLALGNGSFDGAVRRMLEHQKKTNDTASRQEYIEVANIEYAWVRPNTGNGNPHTEIAEFREIVYVQTDLILLTNSKTDPEKVEKIAKELDEKKFAAIPAYQTDKGFVITDGNHRVKAAIKVGHKFIPVILLTKEEFDHVAYSTNELDFIAYIPDHPQFYQSK